MNNNNSGPWGNNDNNQNPWGRRPNNQTPPDVDEIIKNVEVNQTTKMWVNYFNWKSSCVIAAII